MTRLGLRDRLTVGTLVVLFVALTGGGIASYVSMRWFLLERVDANLDALAERSTVVPLLVSGAPVPVEAYTEDLPAQVYLALYDEQGRTVLVNAPEDLRGPGRLAVPGPGQLGDEATHVPDGVGGAGLRVRSLRIEEVVPVVIDGRQDTVAAVVVGVSMQPSADTLRRLAVSHLLIGAVLLAVGVPVLRRVLAVGLRPLTEVTATARAVGAGELARRVDHADPRTEVGQVGAALNDAFDRRDRSEAMMRSFVADASHELRTPLSTVQGWADLYLNDGVVGDDEVDLAMRRIRDEAARMSTSVEQLLVLARLDARQPLPTTAVDLLPLAAEVVADAVVRCPGHVVLLVSPDETGSQSEDPSVCVLADEDAARRVLANLLSNAVVHTPPASHVVVEVFSDDTTAGVVVRDDGPGLSAAERDLALDRFWRAQSSRPHGGSGLGLAIVHDLVGAHGGTVRLDEAPEGGLLVEVRWPAAHGDGVTDSS